MKKKMIFQVAQGEVGRRQGKGWSVKWYLMALSQLEGRHIREGPVSYWDGELSLAFRLEERCQTVPYILVYCHYVQHLGGKTARQRLMVYQGYSAGKGNLLVVSIKAVQTSGVICRVDLLDL